jgi:hypothetical protein
MKPYYFIVGGALLLAVGFVCGMMVAPQPKAVLQVSTVTPQGEATEGQKEAVASAQQQASRRSADSEALPTDVNARFQAILHAPSQRARMHALITLADGLSPVEIKAALDQVGKISPRYKSTVLTELLGQWAVTDPHSATAYAMAISHNGDRAQALNGVAAGWAETDPKGAEAWVASLQDRAMKNSATVGLISTVASSDRQTALALAEGLPENMLYSAAYAIFGSAADDPQSVASEVNNLPPGTLRSIATQNLASNWAAQDPAAALNWSQTLPQGNTRQQAVQGVINSWAQSDPAAAAAYASQLPPSSMRQQVLQNVVSNWERNDPDAVATWLQQMPAGAEREQAIMSAVGNNQDAQQALQLVALMQPGSNQDNAISNAASNWARTDSQGAIAWAQQQTDPHIQTEIWPQIIGQVAGTDVQTALSLTQNLSGPARSNAMSNVIMTWANNDPSAAAAYVAQMPAGSDQDNNMGMIAANWIQSDPGGATQWLNSLPAGPGKDSALGSAVSNSFDQNPADAMSLASAISDDSKRQSLEQGRASQWLNTDRTAATAWIESSDLPQGTKDSLLKPK